MKRALLVLSLLLALVGCSEVTQTEKDRASVERQQSQYAASQPVPVYNWSLERHLVIQLYDARNLKAATHSVWRSDRGMIEGDCPSMGFGIPYDTSLTNPLKAVFNRRNSPVVEQSEPNGIFASKNTAATWVMCVNKFGIIEPVYVETKVTTYPYPVSVDYDRNRVKKAGKSTVTISTEH